MTSRYNSQLNDAVKAAVDLNFHPEHGAPYHLGRMTELGLDYKSVKKEVQTVEELGLLGDFPEHLLAERPWQFFVPASMLKNGGAGRFSLYQTGGTTGRIKTVPVSDETYHKLVEEAGKVCMSYGVPECADWFYMGPTGPHFFAYVLFDVVKAIGSPRPHAIDLDTRYVRKLADSLYELGMRVGIPRDASKLEILKRPWKIPILFRLASTSNQMNIYMGHVLNQCWSVIETQRPPIWVTTGKLLAALRDDMRSRKVRVEDLRLQYIMTGGVALDPKEYQELREFFHDIPWVDVYGSTYWGACFQDINAKDGRVYNITKEPPIVLEVLNTVNRQPVEYGQEGVVAIHRLAPEFFINLVERDVATRVRPAAEGESDRVANVHPAQQSQKGGVY